MTQKYVPVSAYAVCLILVVGTAWAETKKETTREQLPAPKACCETAGCCAASCCTTAQASAAASKETCVECRLGKSCSVDFKDTPLEEVLDQFRQSTGINIVADEPALTEAGVSLQRPITLRVDGLPLKQTLQMLLHQAHLSYVVQDGVVLITTESQARGKLTCRIHPVGDLLSPADPLILPIGQSDVFLGWSMHTPAGMRLLDETPEETLINLITDSIEPASWCDSGGLGTIDYFATGKSLVVNQTPDVQEQVANLLCQLRHSCKDENTAENPTPSLGLHMPPPFACPLIAPRVIQAPAMVSPDPMTPPLFTLSAPLPAPQSAPNCPVPQACPVMSPMPAPKSPGSKTYLLDVGVFKYSPDGKAICMSHPKILLRAEPSFHSNVALVEREEGECRQWLLQVKATAVKDERLHLEVTSVRAEAQNANNGQVVLDLAANPLLDRKVKLGKMVKKILERDEKGKPRKWVELMVKELEPAGMPAAERVPSPAVAPPLACTAAPPACQAAYVPVPAFMLPPQVQRQDYTVLPPPPAVLECVALQAPDPSTQPEAFRATVEEGKTKIALQHGGFLRCDNLEITLNAGQGRCTDNDTLKVTVSGDQIQIDHPCLQASADTVTSTGADGCLVLEGHVQLRYEKDGQQMSVIAGDRVLVDLAVGHVEVQGAKSMLDGSDGAVP
jgi:hypothetical protein